MPNNPGSYTQLWLSQSAVTSSEELRQEMETYIQIYTNANPDYTGIQVSILNSTDWAGFLTVLPSNQVVLVHSIGLFSSRLGQQTAAHNRIFGLIGRGKVGGKLPPMEMAPAPGLVPWLKIQNLSDPTGAELESLAAGTRLTVPLTEEDKDATTSVQNLCYMPKAWAAYFLAPMSPWVALTAFKKLLLLTLPPPQ
jgi:hypothetical protein